jgi:hypothetical protein
MEIERDCSFIWVKEPVTKSLVTALWREQFETVVRPETAFSCSLVDI